MCAKQHQALGNVHVMKQQLWHCSMATALVLLVVKLLSNGEFLHKNVWKALWRAAVQCARADASNLLAAFAAAASIVFLASRSPSSMPLTSANQGLCYRDRLMRADLKIVLLEIRGY